MKEGIQVNLKMKIASRKGNSKQDEVAIHLIFLDENPDVTSFDLYRPSWEYLKDCTKFASITKELQTNPAVRLKKKKQMNLKLPSSYSAQMELVEAMMQER